MKLKNDKFYDPGLKNTGISDSEYRKEYTRLYVNYAKRMAALKRNGFAWTKTYKEFRGIPKPSELKTVRGIRNNLKGLKDFFDNPLTSTREQQRTKKIVIQQFNKKNVPLTEENYKPFLQFLDWLADNFANIAFSSGQVYKEWEKAVDASPTQKAQDVYKTFLAQHKNLKPRENNKGKGNKGKRK